VKILYYASKTLERERERERERGNGDIERAANTAMFKMRQSDNFSKGKIVAADKRRTV
jgi:hypothetical protein